MGHPDLRILYLTPETLFSYRCSSELEAAYKQRQLRRLVVDEVSRWLFGSKDHLTDESLQAHVIEVS